VELPPDEQSPSAVEQLRSLVSNIAGDVFRLPSEKKRKPEPVGQTGVVPMLEPPRSRPRPPRAPMLGQFLILTERYLELMWRDKKSVWLLALQAPIVALFILIGFANKPYQEEIIAPRDLDPEERLVLQVANALSEELSKELKPEDEQKYADKIKELLTLQRVQGTDGQPIDPNKVIDRIRKFRRDNMIQQILDSKLPVVPDRKIVNPRYTYMLLFILSVTVIWFGCNNAAKEIVKEDAIYSRERAVNLGIFPYLGSKFVVLSVLTAFHTLILMVVIYGGLALLHAIWPTQQVPDESLRQDYLTQYGLLSLLGVAGVAMGLLVSACVGSPDRASTLLPYVLIPQIILGGGIMAVSSQPLWTLSHVSSPVYWAYRGTIKVPPFMPDYFKIDMYMEPGIGWPLAALGIQIVVLMALTVVAMRAKDVR
jgi:hypothetical protein